MPVTTKKVVVSKSTSTATPVASAASTNVSAAPVQAVVASKKAAAASPAPAASAAAATTTKKVVKKVASPSAVDVMPASSPAVSASPSVVEAMPAAPAAVVASGEEAVEEGTTAEVFAEIYKNLATLTSTCKSLALRVKNLQKQVSKEHKELSKKGGKKKANSGKPRAPSGFAKPSKITPELAAFLGVNESEKFARTQVTKMITEYVKQHSLQNQENKKIITPDAKLKKLLNNGNEEVSFFNLQKFMKVHYVKDAPAPTPVSV
jgi:upstream activation factor subunit UAF30